MEQIFCHQKTVFTSAVTRMAIVDMKTHKRVSPTEMFTEAFAESSSPPIPQSAQCLNALIKAQRQETQLVTDAHAQQGETTELANPSTQNITK